MLYSLPVPEIDVQQLALRLAEKDPTLQLIDVREPEEIAIAYIEGFKVFPLSEFAQWSADLLTNFDPTAETIVICHHGVRSAQMCQWLLERNFTNVKNVTGGIDAYSRLVDSTVPFY